MNYDYRNFRRGGALRKFTLLTLVSALAVMTTLFSCSTRDVQARGQALDQKTQDALKKYWNRGGAELTAYKLSQARYGESHPGFAVLVFVTEEFLTDKQVKLESKWRPAAAPILKLNFVRKFLTGIYKYSAMTSVFTPLDTARYPQSLKVTTSMQEWCGHIFQQFNLRDNRYKVQGYSYFEDEGDSKYELEAVHMEDDFWTRLRLSPELLPTGKIKIIPGTYFARLRHVKSKVEEALASREVWKKSGYPGKKSDGLSPEISGSGTGTGDNL